MSRRLTPRDPSTAEELLRFLAAVEDGARHELIGGEHVVSPNSAIRHQDIAVRLLLELRKIVEEAGHGRVFFAVNVKLGERDLVIPDLVCVLATGRARVDEVAIDGAPDLVVEIVSPSTRRRDLETKRSLYERYGVPEYWVILPERDRLLKHVRSSGKYLEPIEHESTVELSILGGGIVELTRIW